MDNLAIEGKGFQLVQLGLKIEGDPTWQEYWAVGQKLMTVHDGMQLAIGDWVNYGHNRWGEKYLEALEKTPYQYATLRHMVWVCKRFPLDIREQMCPRGHKVRIGYIHLRTLAGLTDDQVIHILELMGDRKWTVAELEACVARTFPRPDSPARFEEQNTADDEVWKKIRACRIFGKPGGPGFLGYAAIWESDLKRPEMIVKRLELPREK